MSYAGSTGSSAEDGTDLGLLIEPALSSIALTLTTGRRSLPVAADLPPSLRQEGATFVTLRRQGRLLGCIGSVTPYRPVGVDVAANALAAAFDDPRMPPIDHDDFAGMDVEISQLGALSRLQIGSYPDALAAIRPGLDGVLVTSGRHRAVLLPAVWHDLPEPEGFLAALWAKAGMTPGRWSPGTEVQVFGVVEVAAPGPRPAAMDWLSGP